MTKLVSVCATAILLLLMSTLLTGCYNGNPFASPPPPTATPAPTATRVPTATPIPPPTQTPTAAATATPTATATPVATPTPAALSDAQIVQTLSPSTVQVKSQFGKTVFTTGAATTQDYLASGTGIVYDTANGYLVTNAHVVEGASSIVVRLSNGVQRPAVVVGRSPCDDLAVLHIDDTSGLNAAAIDRVRDVQPGDHVVTLGYPLSFQLGDNLSNSAGSVSQVGASLGKYQNLLKIDAAINHGNSGGPLIDVHGHVIGINTLSLSGAQGTNYSIAMSYAWPIIKKLQTGRNLHYVGLNLVPNDSTFQNLAGTPLGVAVAAVASGSPADQVGILPADLILKVEGNTVASEDDVCGVLTSRSDGNAIKVIIYRYATNQLLQGEMTIGQSGVAQAGGNLTVIGYGPDGTQPAPTATTPAGSGSGGGSGDTPTAPSGSGGTGAMTTVLDTNFSSNNAGPWKITATRSVSNGHYNISVASGKYSVTLPNNYATIADGAVLATVQIEGTGRAGVIARYTATSDDKWTMYFCWISSSNTFGCSKDVQDHITSIVSEQSSAAIKSGQSNVIGLGVTGNQVEFDINGQKVATYSDTSGSPSPLPQGGWGLYHEDTGSSFIAHYGHVIIDKV